MMSSGRRRRNPRSRIEGNALGGGAVAGAIVASLFIDSSVAAVFGGAGETDAVAGETEVTGEAEAARDQ